MASQSVWRRWGDAGPRGSRVSVCAVVAVCLAPLAVLCWQDARWAFWCTLPLAAAVVVLGLIGAIECRRRDSVRGLRGALLAQAVGLVALWIWHGAFSRPLLLGLSRFFAGDSSDAAAVVAKAELLHTFLSACLLAFSVALLALNASEAVKRFTVAAALAGVVFALTAVSLYDARQSAQRTQTSDNLRSMGLAFHQLQAANKPFHFGSSHVSELAPWNR